MKKIKLNKHEQQMVLACKYHGEYCRIYQMKVIIADYIGNNIKDIHADIVYYWLFKLYLKLINNDMNELLRLLEIRNLFQDSWTGEHKESIDIDHLNKKLITEIAMRDVFDKDGSCLFEELEIDEHIMNRKY